jgi:HNH endonuclease
LPVTTHPSCWQIFCYMKLIRLYGTHWDKFAIVDDLDYEWLSKIRWTGSKCYHCDNIYVCGVIDGRRVKMHNLVTRNKTSNIVDHKNRDSLDNRLENLRICTPQLNGINHGININNKTGYKGVSLHKGTKNKIMQMTVNGKRTHIGSFVSASHAALAHDLWTIDVYGEYAYTNFKVISHSSFAASSSTSGT